MIGKLRVRLCHHSDHWPLPVREMKTIPCCQLHGFLTDGVDQPRKKIMRCEACNVFLCVDCFGTFHKVEDLVAKKKLCKELLCKELPSKVKYYKYLFNSY